MDSTTCLSKRRRSTDCYNNNNNNFMVSLPMDIVIEFILSKLDMVAFHCFSAVCRSWQSIAIAAKKRLPFLYLQPQLPWLMLSSSWVRHPRFFSLYHDKFFKLKLVEARGARCCGSSWGWLIMAGQGNIFLLNPFTHIKIQLPRRAIFPIAPEEEDEFQLDEYLNPRPTVQWLQDKNSIRKAMLLSPPTVPSSNSNLAMLAPDCVVAVIDERRSLSICRLTDEAWTYIANHGHIDEGIKDIIYYNGRVYAIDCFHFLIQVELGPSPKLKYCYIGPSLDAKAENFLFSHSIFGDREALYLVECLGELLLVIRRWNFVCPDCPDPDSDIECKFYYEREHLPRTNDIEIFKLDPKGRFRSCWTRVENLGDQMLFVGLSRGFSISTLDYPSLRGNCIYFTEVKPQPRPRRHLCTAIETLHDTGVFYLEDKSFKQLVSDDPVLSTPIWFSPSW